MILWLVHTPPHSIQDLYKTAPWCLGSLMQSHHYHGGQINGLQNAEQNSPLPSTSCADSFSAVFLPNPNDFSAKTNMCACLSVTAQPKRQVGHQVYQPFNINMHKVHTSKHFKLH